MNPTWPNVVTRNPVFQKVLEQIVTAAKNGAKRKGLTMSNSEVSEQAAVVQATASKLLNQIADLRDSAPLWYDLKERAEDRVEQDLAPDESGMMAARLGFDLHEIQIPLMGLIAYMQEIQLAHKGKSSKNSSLSRITAEMVILACMRYGLDAGKKQSPETRAVVRATFAFINEHEPLAAPFDDSRITAMRKRYMN